MTGNRSKKPANVRGKESFKKNRPEIGRRKNGGLTSRHSSLGKGKRGLLYRESRGGIVVRGGGAFYYWIRGGGFSLRPSRNWGKKKSVAIQKRGV